MSSFNPQVHSNGILQENLITVNAAAEITGYNVQYLRRLLRARRLDGIKIGQVWLIRMKSMKAYLYVVEGAEDCVIRPMLISDFGAC